MGGKEKQKGVDPLKARIGEKRISAEGVEETLQDVFRVNELVDTLEWYGARLSRSLGHPSRVRRGESRGLMRPQIIRRVTNEEKREHHDLRIQIVESISTKFEIDIKHVEVWQDGPEKTHRYVEVFYNDPKQKSKKFRLSAYEPGGSAPVLPR